MNVRAWSVWSLLETQWNVAPMGGIIGWGGYEVATRMLNEGYRAKGDELLAEIERLKLFENAQLEIESARRKWKEKHKGKKGGAEAANENYTEGDDLDDFWEDAIVEDEEES